MVEEFITDMGNLRNFWQVEAVCMWRVWRISGVVKVYSKRLH